MFLLILLLHVSQTWRPMAASGSPPGDLPQMGRRSLDLPYGLRKTPPRDAFPVTFSLDDLERPLKGQFGPPLMIAALQDERSSGEAAFSLHLLMRGRGPLWRPLSRRCRQTGVTFYFSYDGDVSEATRWAPSLPSAWSFRRLLPRSSLGRRWLCFWQNVAHIWLPGPAVRRS